MRVLRKLWIVHLCRAQLACRNCRIHCRPGQLPLLVDTALLCAPLPSRSTGSYASGLGCKRNPYDGVGYVRGPCSALSVGDPCYTLTDGYLVCGNLTRCCADARAVLKGLLPHCHKTSRLSKLCPWMRSALGRTRQAWPATAATETVERELSV